jgi:hypothetical protein
MKKYLLSPLLAALSILLCAFSILPAPKAKEDMSMTLRFTTDITSDGSGTLGFEIDLSKEMMSLLKSSPGFSADSTCSTYFESGYDDWETKQEEHDGALTCSAKSAFEDLDELKSLVEGEGFNAKFDRLEIKDGHLYYDLTPNMTGSSIFGEAGSEMPFKIEAYWIVNMPGEVVETNADETSGQTLKWNLMKMNAASHFRAESKLGGGGLDPTLTVIGVIALLGCCCVVVLIAAGAAFFFLRRKNQPSTAA